VFSQRVEALMDAVLAIRVHVEAAIDFADEPLETLGGGALRERLDAAIAQLAQLQREAERGQKLRDGLHVVLVGPPNAGKSSLLNALAGSERAIVTDLAGTTRDLLRETIRLDGVELTLVDTAGLREAGDAIEAEGIRRARSEVARADLALAVLDARDPEAGRAAVADGIAGVPRVLWLYNKADLLPQPPIAGDPDHLPVSAKTGLGLEALHLRLLALSGAGEAGEGAFSARARHVQALAHAADALADARRELAGERLELAADALAQAHSALGDIGGRLSADGLLGHIFSSFCIGK
jgi:tRNA modification GTPase